MQAEVTLANATKKAELRAVLEASLAKKGALETGREKRGKGDDEHEHDSSHDQRLKQYYTFPDVGEIAVTDGAGAYQVHCGLGKGNFKVIDKPASPSQSTSSPGGEAPEESSSVPQEGDHGGARPKVFQVGADAPRESAESELEEERTVDPQAPQGPSEATRRMCHPGPQGGRDDAREAPQDSEPEVPGGARTASAQAPRESQYQETPPCAPSLEPPRKGHGVAATEPLETTRGRLGDRQYRGAETLGGSHPSSAPGAEGGLIRDVGPIDRRATTQGRSMSPEPTMDLLRSRRTRSRSRTSRRGSPAAPRSGFLDTAAAGRPRTPEQLQRATPFGFSRTDARGPSRIASGNPREWSTVGEHIAPQARELSPIAPVGLETPTDQPACLRPAPARPLYRESESEVVFRTPGHPPVLQGSEHLPSTEPMGRYSRVTRLERENDQTVRTPRARIDGALEETQRSEHHRERRPEQDIRDGSPPPRRGRSPSSQASSSRSTEDHLETLYLQQSRLLGVLQAPKVSISSFDGDPMAYFPFIRAFEENVEKLLDDEGSKLARLMQLCTGKAAWALQCCSMLPPAQGYRKARQILKARFGDPFTITEVWVDKLTEGGPCTNLQEYADDLQNCYECLTALGAASELQSQSSLVALVRKLPPSLQNRWRDVAYELKEKEGRRPELRDIVKFTGRAAAVAADPVYGAVSTRLGRPDRSSSKSSYVALAEVGCPICKEERHGASLCPMFIMKIPGDRLQAAIEARLCFVCLRTGHITRDCPARTQCKVRGCNRWHAILLHKANWKQFRKESRQRREAREPEPSAELPPERPREPPSQAHKEHPTPEAHYSASFHVRSSKAALPLLPVRVSSPETGKTVETYALLDSGSNVSLCQDRLLESLGATG